MANTLTFTIVVQSFHTRWVWFQGLTVTFPGFLKFVFVEVNIAFIHQSCEKQQSLKFSVFELKQTWVVLPVFGLLSILFLLTDSLKLVTMISFF